MISTVGFFAVGGFYIVGVIRLLSDYQPTKPEKPPRLLFTIEKRGAKPLESPTSVQIANGRLYVGGLKSVSTFARNGRWLDDFSLSLGETGSIVPYVHDMTADGDGRMYVTIGPVSAVMVFDWKGRLASGFPPANEGKTRPVKAETPLLSPIGISYDKTRKTILFTDVGDHAVKEYAVTGRLLRTIGRAGDKPGTFTYPNGIIRGTRGEIYIADSNNARVQVFENNRFSRFLVPPEDNPFVRPKALALDKLGRVHVVDTLKSLVYVFARDGRFLFIYGDESTGEGRMQSPTDIAIDQDTGQVFIADRGSNRVFVWGK